MTAKHIFGFAFYIALTMPWCAKADFWANPKTFEVTSENGRFAVQISVATDTSPSSATVFAIAGGTRKAVWNTPLSNKVRPLEAWLSNDGEYLVTKDNFFNVGYGDDVVAFYNRRGQIRKWSFNQIFPQFSATILEKFHDHLKATHPALEEWLPGKGSDPRAAISHKMMDTSASRFWTENGIVFIDSASAGSAFCIWLGWDMRWIAWDIKTGKMLTVTRSRIKLWGERGRLWALGKLKMGAPDGGAMTLLSQLRKPEDRVLLEHFLRYPAYDCWLGYGETLGSASSARILADSCLAYWDGLVRGVTAELLESKQTFFLGSVCLYIKFPKPPREHRVYACLYPDSTGQESWRKQMPESFFLCGMSEDPEMKRGNVVQITIHCVPPGRYWVKVVWDTEPPYTNKLKDGVKPVLYDPQPGDYVSDNSPLITVKAGKTTENINIDCTTLVK